MLALALSRVAVGLSVVARQQFTGWRQLIHLLTHELLLPYNILYMILSLPQCTLSHFMLLPFSSSILIKLPWRPNVLCINLNKYTWTIIYTDLYIYIHSFHDNTMFLLCFLKIAFILLQTSRLFLINIS